MSILIVGLLIFLGVHSLRIFAAAFCQRVQANLGMTTWKVVFALISIVGFVLIVWGFSLARQQPVLLYAPPRAFKHANALFTLIAFILVAAAYIPHNHIKEKIGHPMLAGTKLWAFGHLLAIGFLHDVILFGAFLIWAVLLFVISRRRDRRDGVVMPQGAIKGDILSLMVGLFGWVVFAFFLHIRWIGVNPFT